MVEPSFPVRGVMKFISKFNSLHNFVNFVGWVRTKVFAAGPSDCIKQEGDGEDREHE